MGAYSGVSILVVLGLMKCLIVPAFCQKDILLYLEFQYQGNSYPISVREQNKCIKVNTTAPVKSIYSEFCVLLYPTTDCSGSWIKQLEGFDGVSLEKPSTPEDPSDFYQFQSWFPCNKSFDGGAIDVEIDGSLLFGRIGIRNVCECRSLGTGSTYKYINAGGNCLKVFSDENCQGRSQEYPHLYNHSYPLYITKKDLNQVSEVSEAAVSFMPCKIPRSCTFISGTIYKVDLHPGFKNQTTSFVERQPIPVYTRNITDDYTQIYGKSSFVDTTISLTPPGLAQGYGVWRKNTLDKNVSMTNNTMILTLNDDKWRQRFLQTLLVDFGTGSKFLNFTLNHAFAFKDTRPVLKHGHYDATANVVIQKAFYVPYVVHMRVSGKWGSGQIM